MSDDHVSGLPELYNLMQQIPVKYERNVARGALRAGMNVVKPVAQQMARKASGVYAAGLKVGTRARGGVVTSNLKPSGPHAFLGKWIEFGTHAHNIAAKKNGWLSFMNIFRKEVAHPGARPFPHLRPALDSMAGPAVIAVAQYTKNRLETKHGLDTSDVRIEGDL